MRIITACLALSLVSTAALALDLSKFGGATPAMQHTEVSKTTTTQTTASVSAAAQATPKDSGSDTTTVPLDTTTSEPLLNEAGEVVSEPNPDVMPANTVAKPQPPMAKNTMPEPVMPPNPDTPVETPKPKYIYKGDKLVNVPPLQVRDPRVDDSYVQDMFPPKKHQ